ncbi:importin subunit alpha, putative [Entamoeba invadens IP1]|uniref:Importin subunit alpha, putative n=1 Tax=Entamoeba invadens IP1 TaxID=370355 RepID=A0A0A1UFS2_ENTIV|nr:importin subunit alpha, putative [Entamoeba invadens IP1]ELP92920.1 importin subunit alpha, putative [Entamoeba invadens IP1]|eukprot:XP_004259691.1 importin subunit alpha, putative [Entamoeba invadens IP1]
MYRKYDTSLAAQCSLRRNQTEIDRHGRREDLLMSRREIKSEDNNSVDYSESHITNVLRGLVNCNGEKFNEYLFEFKTMCENVRSTCSNVDMFYEKVQNSLTVKRLLQVLTTADTEMTKNVIISVFINLTFSQACLKQMLDNQLEYIVLPLLSTPHQTNVLWLYANLSGENAETRDSVYSATKETLLQMYQTDCLKASSVELIRLISNFCRFKPHISFEGFDGFFKILMDSLRVSNDNAKCVLSAFLNLVDSDEAVHRYESNILSVIVYGINNSDLELFDIIVNFIGDIVYRTDNYIDTFIQRELMERMITALQVGDENVSKDVLWCLSNIVASNLTSVHNKIEQTGIVKLLIEMLLCNTTANKLRYEVAWCFVNILSILDEEEITRVVQHQNFFEAMKAVTFIQIKRKDEKSSLMEFFLQSVRKILTIGNIHSVNGYNIYASSIEENKLSDIIFSFIDDCELSLDVSEEAREITEKYFCDN